ncbi:hypothetical protein [Motilibacter aurantiacus]|uniref:hypothetical protein n=1 Tax=Motilibacter aurantiacus TaxID=2714955 RepID=UPI00140B109C|nr:hypothetical protein [Motilibacter aurantiacus]NHC45629.1 hypothetical protein [Motilibacter aurantiacus]
MSASPGPDSPLGPDAARLLDALIGWARTAADELEGRIATGTPECAMCPLCRAIAALRTTAPAGTPDKGSPIASVASAAAAAAASAAAQYATQYAAEQAARAAAEQAGRAAAEQAARAAAAASAAAERVHPGVQQAVDSVASAGASMLAALRQALAADEQPGETPGRRAPEGDRKDLRTAKDDEGETWD